MDDKEVGNVIMGLTMGIILGILSWAVYVAAAPDYRQQAIEHGYAEYHPQTGEWQWIENERKDDNE